MRPSFGQPMNRVSLVAPFCRRLDAEGVDLAPVLGSVGLTRDLVEDPDAFAPAPTLYAFCERAAHVLNDPFLGVRVGLELTPATWRPDREATEGASTLIEYFTQFILGVEQHAGATRYALDIAAPLARLRYWRSFETDVPMVQVTGLGVGRMVALLRGVLGDAFDIRRLTVITPHPDAVSAPELAGLSFVRSERDTTYAFPAEWLMARFAGGLAERHDTASAPPTDVVGALREMLKGRLSHGDLSLDEAAGLLGRSAHSLRRTLRASGWQFRGLVDDVRREAALDLLRRGESASATAAALGFADAANFSRAFKRWTGTSPSLYAARTRG